MDPALNYLMQVTSGPERIRNTVAELGGTHLKFFDFVSNI